MNVQKWLAAALTTTAAATLLLGVTATPAEACGGFFCSRTPVDQTGEQILFAQIGDEIEAHVNIQYQGEADDFAWIVPVPTVPEVNVSTQDLFNRLRQNAGVRFNLQFEGDDDCLWRAFPPSAENDSSAGGNSDANNGGGVTVVQQSNIGPYETAVLKASSTDALFEWLRANEYDIPANVMPFVEPYVLMGGDIHFVAFRLQSDRSVGDLQPVRMRYKSLKPMVPIQLTAIASQPDMAVTVNILAEQRAVPENYLHVHINEARIDWLNNGSNYNEVVTLAMNEAGGQGYATEYAGDSSIMDGSLYLEGMFDTAALAELTDPLAFFQGLLEQGFQGDNKLQALFMRFLPMPEELIAMGVQPRDFYNCLECYIEFIDRENFDAVGFANALESDIVEPRRHAQQLFTDLPYLTRLHTTMSAEEMNRDPVFAYNPDLGEVSNQRNARGIVACNSEDPDQATVTIVLEDGREITRGLDFGVPAPELDAEPAAVRIEETSSTGQALLVRDTREGVDMLDDVLAERERENNRPMITPGDGGPDTRTVGQGCSTTPMHDHTSTGLMSLLLLGLGMVFLRRKK